MPRVAIPNRRIQRAFAPLVFRTHFQPKQCLTTPPLPWNITYPPHGDGKPTDNAPAAAIEGRPSVNNVPPIKIKRPQGEPGQKGCRGFVTKDVLDLPEGMYEDLLVSFYYIFSPATSHSFHRGKFTVLLLPV